MAGNTFGTLFRITTFGESHGPLIGVVIDGCYSGIQLDLELIRTQLSRRKPGQSAITTQRMEDDEPEVVSGLINGITTGAPLTLLIRNKDQRPADYDALKILTGHHMPIIPMNKNMAFVTIAEVAGHQHAKQLHV